MPSYILKSFNFKDEAIKIFDLLKNEPNTFFLDSGINHFGLGRFSFFGYQPFLILKTKDSPFKELRRLLNEFKIPLHPQIPFLGGAVGYFAYDVGFSLEKIESKATDDINIYDTYLAFYDVIIALDNLESRLHIICTGLPEKNSYLRQKRAQSRLKEIIDKLSGYANNNFDKALFEDNDILQSDAASNFTKENYISAIKKAKEYIRKGDIYQVNLSQRFKAGMDRAPQDLYLDLRKISPAPFAAYLDCQDYQIISSSPERFLQLKGHLVQTRPMKGTRRRGGVLSQDALLKEELLNSAKDKAELVMIVDLERNDLGRVCEYGSVKVKSLRDLEEYATVFQTTATIEGTLHKDKDRVDLIKACFPGGSITGCPKIRAMQIIEELEPTKRGIYTGSLGYLSFSGDMDLNILIRTILFKNKNAYFQVGGGIVADSNPEDEYQETLVKAKALFKAINYKEYAFADSLS